MRTLRYLGLWLELRHIGRHKLRTLLTLLSLAVGVATFIFAPTLVISITRSFSDAIVDLAGHAQIEIRGAHAGFRPRILTLTRQIDGIAIAAPLVQAAGVLPGRSEVVAIFGIDPAVDQAIRVYDLAQGRFLQRSGEALLSAAYTRERDFQIGERVTLLTAAGSRAFTLVGTLAATGVARLNNGDIAIVNYREAQELRANTDLDAIAITLQPDHDRETMLAQLRAALPDDVTIESTAARRATLEDIQGVLNFVIGFSSVLLLSLGATLVYNTLAMAVAQRRVEIGVLRALGVRRRTVRDLFLVEAALMGAGGALPGIALGYWLVQTAGQVIDLSALYSANLTSHIVAQVPAWLALAAFCAGVGTSMLAGYRPARSAARVDPLEALAPARAEVRFARFNRRRQLIGVLALFSSAILLILYTTAPHARGQMAATLPLILGAALMMIGGVLMALPGLIVLLGRALIAPLQRGFGISGFIAAQRLSQNSKRVSASASVLLIGAWAAVVVSSTNFGFRAFADEWEASENVWDVTITGPGSSPFRPALSLPTSLLEKVARRSDVAGVVAERIKTIETATGEIDVRALDLAAFRAQGARFLWNKGDEATAYARLIDPSRPAVLLSSFASFAANVLPGELITVETPRGPRSFEVVGTILGAIDPVGLGKASLIMDRDLYRRLWQDNRVDRLLIRLQPGAEVAAVRRDLQHAYTAGGFIINSPADLTAMFSRSISSMTVVSQVLSIMLLVTLTLGITNTLIIDVLDRRRELGVWRALGLRGRQVTASVVIEVAIVVMLISALAVPMGMFTNYANTLSMAELFAMRFVLSPGEVAVSLTLLCGAALSASYWPARQAGRVDVLTALHDE